MTQWTFIYEQTEAMARVQNGRAAAAKHFGLAEDDGYYIQMPVTPDGARTAFVLRPEYRSFVIEARKTSAVKKKILVSASASAIGQIALTKIK